MTEEVPGDNRDKWEIETNQTSNNLKNKGNKKKVLRTGSLNVQNIRGNSLFILNTMKNLDLLLIQEHWLFKFEENEFSNLFPNLDFYARYVDDENPISHAERIRGYGGVAFLWNKSLTPFIKALPDSNNHIIAIEIETKPKPLCIINAYMPCRGRKTKENQYNESLDVIREIINKYRHSHQIILGGDLNASLHREPPNNSDKALQTFIQEVELTTPDNYPTKPTFYHHDNKSSSQIDYFLLLKDQIKE